MNEEEQRAAILEFEKNRQLLANVSAQKQQLKVQSGILKVSLEELKSTKEKTVLKVVGNILISKDTKEMEKEVKENQEIVDLKIKTLDKQEEITLKKLNSLKAQLESPKQETDKTEISKKRKK